MTKEELLKRKQQIEQVELPKVSMLKQRGGLPYMIGGAVLVGAISYKIKPNILVTLLGLGIGAFAGKKLNKFIIDHQNDATLTKSTALKEELLKIENELKKISN